MLEEIIPEVDLVVVMTVNPGFGHQHFLPRTLQKIKRVRHMIDHINVSCELEVDGGIDTATATLASAAGANVFVAGSAVFGEGTGVGIAMDRLRAGVRSSDSVPAHSVGKMNG